MASVKHFTHVVIEPRVHTWELGPLADAMVGVMSESPIHVSLVDRIDNDATRERLRAGFEDAFRSCLDTDGNVTYDAPYVIVTALRR